MIMDDNIVKVVGMFWCDPACSREQRRHACARVCAFVCACVSVVALSLPRAARLAGRGGAITAETLALASTPLRSSSPPPHKRENLPSKIRSEPKLFRGPYRTGQNSPSHNSCPLPNFTSITYSPLPKTIDFPLSSGSHCWPRWHHQQYSHHSIQLTAATMFARMYSP